MLQLLSNCKRSECYNVRQHGMHMYMQYTYMHASQSPMDCWDRLWRGFSTLLSHNYTHVYMYRIAGYFRGSQIFVKSL